MTHWGQKKLSKESSDGRSGGGGGGGADDRQLSAEFRKKLDEWQKMKGSVDAEEPPPSAGAGKSFAKNYSLDNNLDVSLKYNNGG